MNDILIFSEENLLKQLDDAEYKLGFYRVRFYTRSGVLSNAKTDEVSDFYTKSFSIG